MKINRKNSKGFTLIELLVVVAIIGILAAVGIVAYNGYTAAAKKNAAKTIHAQVMKYIAAESTKCAIDGSSEIFGSKKSAPDVSPSDAAVNCQNLTATSLITYLTATDGSSPLEHRDPYDGEQSVIAGAATGAGNKSGAGNVILSVDATDSGTILLYTCYDNDTTAACGTDVSLENSVEIE